MNPKLYTATDANGRPLSLFMTAGQISDYNGATALLEHLKRAKWLPAGRDYDADVFRAALEGKGMNLISPGGSCEPKLTKHVKRRYKWHNCIEIML